MKAKDIRRGALVLSSLTWIFSAGSALAQPRVEVKLFPGSITVGDQVEATLTVSGEGVVAAPRFPSWSGKSWGRAEVLEVGEPERDGGVWRQRVVLTGWAPGVLGLPPVDVWVPMAGGTVAARTREGLAVEVRSVLPPGTETPKPKPEEPLRTLPIGERFWWTLAVGGLLLAGAIALYARRRAAEEAAGEGAPRLAPLPELLAELDRLESEQSALKAHTRLSHALRRYLGRALGFAALERTTTEIHRQLTGVAGHPEARGAEGSRRPAFVEGLLTGRRLPPPLVRRTAELLRACDLVKFARQEVGRERTAERLAQARAIAEEIERELHPPEEAAALEAAPREAA